MKAPTVRLLRLDIRCPCGRCPPWWITEEERGRAQDLHPDYLMATWHCRCGRRHEITAQTHARACLT